MISIIDAVPAASFNVFEEPMTAEPMGQIDPETEGGNDYRSVRETGMKALLSLPVLCRQLLTALFSQDLHQTSRSCANHSSVQTGCFAI